MKTCKGCINKSLCPRKYTRRVADVISSEEGNKKFLKWLSEGCKTCPCGICLVKMVCSHVCDEYNKQWALIWRSKEGGIAT